MKKYMCTILAVLLFCVFSLPVAMAQDGPQITLTAEQEAPAIEETAPVKKTNRFLATATGDLSGLEALLETEETGAVTIEVLDPSYVLIRLEKAVLTEEWIQANATKEGITGLMEDYPLTLSAKEEAAGAANEEPTAAPDDSEEAEALQLQSGEAPAMETPDVAIIDTGIDNTHTALAGHLLSGWNFCTNTEAIHNSSCPFDEWHGTHMAGVIAQHAPDASILPLVIFEDNRGYTSDAIKAICYASERGARFINLSFTSEALDNTPLYETIANTDAIFICATGNKGQSVDNNPLFSLPNVVPVAAAGAAGERLGFSNYTANSVLADGWNIESTQPGNTMKKTSGTSVAAAKVTGLAAAAACESIGDIVTVCNQALADEGEPVATPEEENPQQEAAPEESLPTLESVLNPQENIVSLNMESLSTQNSIWTEQAFDFEEYFEPQLIAHGESLYATGGLYSSGLEMFSASTVWQYTGINGEWQAIANMITPRWNHTAIVVNGKIYSACGDDYEAYGVTPLQSLEAFDIESGISAQLSSAPVEGLKARCATDTHIIFLGDALYIYDIGNDSWSVGTTKEGALVSNGQALYSITAAGLYEYNFQTDAWTAKDNTNYPAFGHAVKAGECFYGYDATKVYAFTLFPFEIKRMWSKPALQQPDSQFLATENMLYFFESNQAYSVPTSSTEEQADLFEINYPANGQVAITGQTSWPNSKVAVKITDEWGNLAYLDAVESSDTGQYQIECEIPSYYKYGTYTLSLSRQGRENHTEQFEYEGPGVTAAVTTMGRNITISGKTLSASERVLMRVKNSASQAIAYIGETQSDANKNYSFYVRLPEDAAFGSYDVEVSGMHPGDKKSASFQLIDDNFLVENEIESNVTGNNLLLLTVSAANVPAANKNMTFVVRYDASVYELVDAAAETYTHDTLADLIAGSYIPGTNLKVVSAKAGEITFTMTKDIPSGKQWSGYVNSLRFKSKSGASATGLFTVGMK